MKDKKRTSPSRIVTKSLSSFGLHTSSFYSYGEGGRYDLV